MADAYKGYIICLLAFCCTILAVLVAVQGQTVKKSSLSCDQFLSSWFFGVGLALALVSLIGMVAAFLALRRTLLGHLIAAVFLILILTFALWGSWLVVLFAKEEGRNWWMVAKGSPKKWYPIATCLSEAGLCQRSIEREGKVFIGCCQYPKNTSFIWDINVWANKTTVLCYRCRSCMHAIFSMVDVDWKKGNISFTVMVVLLWILYVLEGYFYWKGGQMPPPLQQQPQEEQPPLPLPAEQQHEDYHTDDESDETFLLPEMEMVVQGR